MELAFVCCPEVLNSAVPGPGTIQWLPHPSMLASVVIVMVVLRNVKGIPRDRWCLSDHQSSEWTRSLLTKIVCRLGCVGPPLFQVPLDGSVGISTDCSVAAISSSRLRNWCAGLYAPTLEKDLAQAINELDLCLR